LSYKCLAIARSGVKREWWREGAIARGRRNADAAPLQNGDAPFVAIDSRWYRWGVAVARHRRAVLAAWVVLLLGCAALYPSLHKVLSEPDNAIDGSQSLQAERMLQTPGFRGAGDEQDAIVFFSAHHSAGAPVYREVVARVLGAARAQHGVEDIVGPYPTGLARSPSRATQPPSRTARSPSHVARSPSHAALAQGHTTVARLALGGGPRARFKDAEALQRAIGRAGGDGVQAWLTGFSALSKDLAATETTDSERSESIGVPLAFVILLLALGAVGAALVPLLLAGSGVLLTSGVIALLARALNFDVFLLTVVTTIGVGIGIDYSLFIVSRFREELARHPATPRAERRRIAHAVGVALATSGRTILYSGVIVALSLSSLLAVGAPVFREFVIGAGATVLCTLAVALTLLPATLAQMGTRIEMGVVSQRLRPADTVPDAIAGSGGWARWALAMMRRPLLISTIVLALLLLAMTPVLGLRSGIALDIPSLSQTPSGKGALALTRSFSAGLTSPLEIVVAPSPSAGGQAGGHIPVGATGRSSHAPRGRSSTAPPAGGPGAAARALEQVLRADRRVAGVVVRSYRGGATLTVATRVAIDSAAAQRLVRLIRGRLAATVQARDDVQVLVGGWPAQSLDATTETTSKLPLVVAITLGIALAFLLVVFRSLVLPLKAVAMNLLATGATLGLVVLVFQHGVGERLLGFSSPGFIQAYLPLTMFVLLFGLSMDYEIFLIRRMQESWLKTGENRWSVASGVEHTARPISAAAAIMVVVFGANMTAQMLELKQFGFALAMAIAIDATLVRLVLVPAFMCLLGERNWWLPDRLARILPRLEID
jgi:putative drug exporter of the RND superfamily